MTAPTWLSARAVSQLPPATAVRVDVGGHRRTIIGRVESASATRLVIIDRNGQRVALRSADYRRVRVIDTVWAPGDLVLRRGVSEQAWRGAIVRAHGTSVQVETLRGVRWMDESEVYDAWVSPPSSDAAVVEADGASA